MRVSYITEKAVTIADMREESEDKTELTLVRPNDTAFVNKYGNNGLVTSIDTESVERLGLHVGCVVDYQETFYSELSASNYAEVRDASIPKRDKAYILTEMANMLEACDRGMISEIERDECFSVISAHVEKCQTQTQNDDRAQ